jgi:hypothetical protein
MTSVPNDFPFEPWLFGVNDEGMHSDGVFFIEHVDVPLYHRATGTLSKGIFMTVFGALVEKFFKFDLTDEAFIGYFSETGVNAYYFRGQKDRDAFLALVADSPKTKRLVPDYNDVINSAEDGTLTGAHFYKCDAPKKGVNAEMRQLWHWVLHNATGRVWVVPEKGLMFENVEDAALYRLAHKKPKPPPKIKASVKGAKAGTKKSIIQKKAAAAVPFDEDEDEPYIYDY